LHFAFCRQHGETALQLAKRSDCEEVATLITAHKKVNEFSQFITINIHV